MTAKKTAPPKVLETPERQWQVAQLAATLATRYEPGKTRPHTGSHRNEYPIPDEDLTLYKQLIEHANCLLDLAADTSGEIEAYRFFSKDQFLSANSIKDRMKQIGWPGMKSEQSIKDFMKRYFETRIQSLDQTINAYKDDLSPKLKDLADNLVPYQAMMAKLESQKEVISYYKHTIKGTKDGDTEKTKFNAHAIFHDALQESKLIGTVKIQKDRLSANFREFL